MPLYSASEPRSVCCCCKKARLGLISDRHAPIRIREAGSRRSARWDLTRNTSCFINAASSRQHMMAGESQLPAGPSIRTNRLLTTSAPSSSPGREECQCVCSGAINTDLSKSNGGCKWCPQSWTLALLISSLT